MEKEEKIEDYKKLIKTVAPNAFYSINKKQLAILLDITVATIDRRIKALCDLPDFEKGKGKNGRVTFSIQIVAEYLADKDLNAIKVA